MYESVLQLRMLRGQLQPTEQIIALGEGIARYIEQYGQCAAQRLYPNESV